MVKTKRITIRLAKEKRDELLAEAKSLGISVSELIRRKLE